ncbi:MAG: hypothetical protein RL033_1586 [Pseudomonadota bacterium]|jgi:2-polyprenyl-6-methoxyphenol hydroxylase-like FAD-dependent oxidoreductase
MRDVEAAVVGIGPAGFFAAVELARHATVALIGRPPEAHPAPPRLELVPEASLRWLQSLLGTVEGIEPFDEPRRVAWQHADAETQPMRAALVDRSVFDRSLLALLCGQREISWELRRVGAVGPGPHVFGPLRARRVLDATGRASLTATRRLRLRRPFFGRSFAAPRPATVQRGFALAALPEGYVVRIVSERHTVLTLFSSSSQARLLSRLPEMAQQAGAGFILEGLPRWEQFVAGPTLHASVQASAGDSPRSGGNMPLRIGDAAFARDTLSSQGLASALADAAYGAAVRSEFDARQLAARQAAGLTHHLDTIAGLVGTCRYVERGCWRDYLDDIHLFRSDIGHFTRTLNDSSIARAEPLC